MYNTHNVVPDIANATIFVLSLVGAHFPNKAYNAGMTGPYVYNRIHNVYFKKTYTSASPASTLVNTTHHTPTEADSGSSKASADDINMPATNTYFAPNLSASSPLGTLSQKKP